ncbi:MAG TPA: carbon-nitrogen family hydrolase [Candidatus Avacidaminococcus intestinavium]|uniref:Carbon-nitrogen family hydrolase n=1 Tax=Candidatus Avacidaminococcus intestinavium TaxID=2840684 RepID=A0A9D1MPT5_9FIRM|nr:carbon-nitrogen family hydrolase [Candidatus Avacidaminococcus intestinavium]
MRISLLQMTIVEKDKLANVKKGLTLLEEAASYSDIIVMPEIWTTGYSLGQLQEKADEPNGELLTHIKEIAVQYNCNIVAGSLPMKLKDKIYNTAPAINKKGEIVDLYSKIHLFGMFKEERFFSAGNQHEVYELDGVPCASTICYDLRFPELYRSLALKGAKIIFVPAEWPESRGNVWKLLLQARAVENQIYICGVNCVGSFKENTFYGHSMLVAPNGEILTEGSQREQILTAEIDLSLVEQMRKTLNALDDVRSELFIR